MLGNSTYKNYNFGLFRDYPHFDGVIKFLKGTKDLSVMQVVVGEMQVQYERKLRRLFLFYFRFNSHAQLTSHNDSPVVNLPKF